MEAERGRKEDWVGGDLKWSSSAVWNSRVTEHEGKRAAGGWKNMAGETQMGLDEGNSI